MFLAECNNLTSIDFSSYASEYPQKVIKKYIYQNLIQERAIESLSSITLVTLLIAFTTS